MPIASWPGNPPRVPGLARALAVSLLGHLAFFWPTPPEERAAVAMAPLLAVLRPAGQPAERAEISSAVSASSLPRLGGVREQGVSRRLSSGDSVEPPAMQPSTVASSTEAETGDWPTARAATNRSPALPAALPATPGLDAEGLRGFRVALAREARRYKQYPLQAIEAGWQGTVEVEVTIRAGGAAKEARLARSGGHAQLDSVAVEMMTWALAAASVPAVLRERDFQLTVPIVFELSQ